MDSAFPGRLTIARLPELVGRRLSPTAWVTIDRERILAFADCTGDHQFIHVDADAVRSRTPFPDVVAHGFLLLSIAAGTRSPDEPEVIDAAMVLNYGIDRLRFVSPVFAGQRVRYQAQVSSAEPRDGGRMLVKRELTLEVAGREEPALVATVLAMYLPQRPG